MVTVEVPTGCKFCPDCGGVFPKDTGFYQQKKVSKSTGQVTLYPRQKCRACHDKASNARPRAYKPVTARKPKPVVARHLPPRPAFERPIDAAFMGWRACTPVAYMRPSL